MHSSHRKCWYTRTSHQKCGSYASQSSRHIYLSITHLPECCPFLHIIYLNTWHEYSELYTSQNLARCHRHYHNIMNYIHPQALLQSLACDINTNNQSWRRAPASELGMFIYATKMQYVDSFCNRKYNSCNFNYLICTPSSVLWTAHSANRSTTTSLSSQSNSRGPSRTWMDSPWWTHPCRSQQHRS